MGGPDNAPRGMKTFFVIWLGELISLIGSGLTGFALAVWIFDRTGQATPFALTVLFSNLPRILLSPVAGSLADRWNRRWVMIFADTGSALVTLAAALILFTGSLEVWHIYLISTFNAVFSAFQEPAYTASTTMLVPKKDLARASGMVQMGQALEMLLSPLLAGALFVAIGLRGIILIDFLTFFFAIGALLVVRIPQPKAAPSEDGRSETVLSDALYGWRYLSSRPGLFGLLWYYALVNFLFNFASVLTGPLVLSFGNAGMLGLVHSILGGGMLIGSIVMSAWGGPKENRIWAVIGFIALAAVGLALTGLQSSLILVAAGMFIMVFCVPLASGPSQAIFQMKVAPEIQGRVFAIRNLISRSMMPLAFLSAGPLADYVFEPLMQPGGLLAQTFAGNLLGVGPGRGIGLIFTLSGLSLLLVSALAYANPRIRRVETELPDMLPESLPTEAAVEYAH